MMKKLITATLACVFAAPVMAADGYGAGHHNGVRLTMADFFTVASGDVYRHNSNSDQSLRDRMVAGPLHLANKDNANGVGDSFSLQMGKDFIDATDVILEFDLAASTLPSSGTSGSMRLDYVLVDESSNNYTCNLFNNGTPDVWLGNCMYEDISHSSGSNVLTAVKMPEPTLVSVTASGSGMDGATVTEFDSLMVKVIEGSNVLYTDYPVLQRR